jgi:hypothetical protein
MDLFGLDISDPRLWIVAAIIIIIVIFIGIFTESLVEKPRP